MNTQIARFSPYFMIPMKGQKRDGWKNYLSVVIGSFDFYRIGFKGQHTDRMKQVPLRFDWLVWFLSNRRQRRLAGFMGFVDNIYDFWPLEYDTLSNPLNLSDLYSLNSDFSDFDIACWNYDGEVMHWFC